MRVVSAGLTDIGCVRKHNEDNFLLDDELGLYIVADGLGGHAAGEVASQIVIERSSQFVATTLEQDHTWPTAYDTRLSYNGNRLRAALVMSDRAIYDNIQANPERESMGSTAVACLLQDQVATVAHVGDSRAYLLRAAELRPLTRDHSWVAEQIEHGFLTPEEARRHPFRNVITQALGNGSDLEVVVREVPVLPDDVLLLCSDGLSGMVYDESLAQILTEAPTLEVAARRMVSMANENGGEDNITVVLVALQPDAAE